MSDGTRDALGDLECKHERKRYVRTRHSYFDGDEDDIYECEDCKERWVEYVPR